MISNFADYAYSAAFGAQCDISIVVPVFNEEDSLKIFHQRLVDQLIDTNLDWEIIYVDDGSQDQSRHYIKAFRLQFPNISLLCLSRNFGKENAMSAGLKVSRGNAVIIMDADLQDPPSLLPRMIAEWRKGSDVVNMRRSSRQGESFLKKITSRLFYKVINQIGEIEIPEGVGDFRLLSRRVVDILNQLPESNRFMKGLFSWVGYKQVTLEFDRDSRIAGKTKWNYWKLWNFALEGITGFSSAPLKLASYIGFFCAFGSLTYAVYFLIKTAVIGDTTPGFPTLVITILTLGGIQLMAIGVLGEYLGRLFTESKKRPLFLIDEYLPPRNISSAIRPTIIVPKQYEI